jgi:hypothetical protein
MSIQSDLSVSPFFDDYSDQKDFYKILFRPGVSVQVRELNQLQTMLQKQIERFGNNIYKQGTIIDGCDITFHSTLQYVKIRDIETNSLAADVNKYRGYRVKNQNDITPLEASVIAVDSGFEATSPDLNTLYLRYLNTGFKTGGPTDGQVAFEASEQLTVYNPEAPIEKIDVLEGSSGFSPTDRVVILSALAVQNTTGGTAFANNFSVGQFLTDGTANVQIIGIDSNTLPGELVLKVSARPNDLQDGDFSKWTFSVNTNVQAIGGTPSSIATVSSIVGSGAAAVLAASALGVITKIDVSQNGSGYKVLPQIAVSSSGATLSQISSFSAIAQTELANITVAPAGFSPVGKSYGMTVGEGVVYQKGYFSRVAEQIVIVEKYSDLPDAKSVGFETIENIIDSNEDLSLLDNATGAPNFTAPGANRLKLTPVLSVISKAEADTRDDWLYIAEFANGNPYKQNRQTVYNVIGKEINRRFNETAGNYVTNPFLLTTKNANTFVNEVNDFNVFIDPGTAFINGSRVETLLNYEAPIKKGTDTLEVTDANISLNYGNFVKVNQLAGHFIFKTGDRVALYTTAGKFIETSVGATPSASSLGTLIGYARLRSLVFDSGVPGTPSCVYRLYLFDVQMEFGKNFADVRSIFYDGANKAVADTVLENGRAVIKDNINSSLIYYAGSPAVANAAGISYIYRTSNTSVLGSTGTITISVPSVGSQVFPYTGTLSSTQLRDIVVVPLANGESSTTSTGTVGANTTSTQVTGTGTLFVSEYREGDYIKFLGASVLGQIESIANDSVLFLTANGAASVVANTHRIAYPANAPIPLERTGRSASVSGDRTQLTVVVDTGMLVPTNIAITYNVRDTVTPVTKTVNRNQFVRIRLSDNAQAEAGPWALGVSDVFRLKKVYRGTNDTFTPSEGVDITQSFYVDHNQTEDYYGISYLYQRPGSALNLTSSDVLLVQFDYFSTTAGQEGLKAPGGSGTYPINDAVVLNSATTTINTVEIPEVFGARGNYYDLRDQFDFRPASNNTVTPSSDFATAPINPAEQTPANRFSGADKKFPAPDSELSAVINHYVGRTDRVIINEANEFRVLTGTPGSREAPTSPENALSINVLKIPPYPSLPYQLSPEMIAYVDTKIANEKYSTRRLNEYRVTTAQTDVERAALQPRGYTMIDIGKLERRIAELEYYTALTLTEMLAQKRALPGFDGSERFKFGFFVDGFEDYTYAEVSNPAYSATIVDGYLSPRVSELNIVMDNIFEDEGTLPFVEETYISQTRATDGPLVAQTAPMMTQIQTSVIQSERNRSTSTLGNVFEEFFYTFSANAGPVEFYINARDNDIGAEISQSNSPNGPWTQILTSAAPNALPITNADIAAKGLRVLNGGRKIEHPGSLERKSYPSGTVFGTFIEDHFKLLWTHNPDNGTYVRIRVYKGRKNGGFLQNSKAGTFGYKLFYPVDTLVNQTGNAFTTNFSLTYNGITIGGGDFQYGGYEAFSLF